MMGIIYTDKMNAEEYNELRDSVAWKLLTPGQAERGLANTAFVVAARDGEKIVGMGRNVHVESEGVIHILGNCRKEKKWTRKRRLRSIRHYTCRLE